MNIIPCDESHAGAILEIFNEAIANSTALWDYKPRTMAMMAAWFDAKRSGNLPVIGVVDDDGELLGFGTYARFRPNPAYKYSVEHSIYVAKPHRGKGVGKTILQQIIKTARKQDYHTLIGGIDATNAASKALHEQFGFKLVGSIPQAGYKFNRWLDLEFYQLILPTPTSPMDG